MDIQINNIPTSVPDWVGNLMIGGAVVGALIFILALIIIGHAVYNYFRLARRINGRPPVRRNLPLPPTL